MTKLPPDMVWSSLPQLDEIFREFVEDGTDAAIEPIVGKRARDLHKMAYKFRDDKKTAAEILHGKATHHGAHSILLKHTGASPERIHAARLLARVDQRLANKLGWKKPAREKGVGSKKVVNLNRKTGGYPK